MRRPITRDERLAAQELIRIKRASLGDTVRSFTGWVEPETNEDGEVVLNYDFVPHAPIEFITLTFGPSFKGYVSDSGVTFDEVCNTRSDGKPTPIA